VALMLIALIEPSWGLTVVTWLKGRKFQYNSGFFVGANSSNGHPIGQEEIGLKPAQEHFFSLHLSPTVGSFHGH
jgi:hypothetical protein